MALLMSATEVSAQTSQSLDLPVSICNQSRWDAVETTVVLNGEEEELTCYKLNGFESNGREQRRGTIYYVPSAVDDRIILVLDHVMITSGVNLPAIIDNRSDKELFVHIKGHTILRCGGDIIRSTGSVNVFGPDADELGLDNTVVLEPGRRSHAAVETAGDIYLQDILLSAGTTDAPHVFMSTGSSEKEPSVLQLNHVEGRVVVKAGGSACVGFAEVLGSNGTQIEGIDNIRFMEEEYGEELEPEDDYETDGDTDADDEQEQMTE